MKRFTMIAALLLMVAMPIMAERVTPETARKVAATFLNNNGAKADQLTDLTKVAGFANLYIFTAENGFVVMAADDCVQPILGYSLEGKFVAEGMPENMIWWLQGYNNEIQSAIENKTKPTVETAKMWKDLIEGNSKTAKATVAVAPLIQTKWNQNKYYNSLCPEVSDGPDGHAYTGCVATAMAQIMKYWSYPAHGIGSHSYTWNGQTLSADFGATTYDWANMADAYECYYVNPTDQYAVAVSNTDEEITAVATLMYHCGVSVDMNYSGGGSGAYSNAVAPALRDYFNYSSTVEYKQKTYTDMSTHDVTTYYSDDDWIAMVKADLDALRPIQYGGADPNSNSGHAFVCDGYNSDNYFHFNWGWAGLYNGYFSINNLDTGANSSEAGAGNGTYTRDQDAIFGIQPGSMIDAPTHLAYTLSGLQDITLTWDGVGSASSYNVYRDGGFIDNTTATTYSETASFGTHEYYIRCVDANSQLSLPSNTVTVTIAYQTPIVDDLTGTLSGNTVSLSWTAPEWCYPEEPSATLTIGTQQPSNTYVPWGNDSYYWGHRHTAETISDYDEMRLYTIEFHANNVGTYELCVFQGTTSSSWDYTIPSTLIANQSIVVSETGWNTLTFSSPVIIDGEQDLWIFVHNPETIDGLSSVFCTAEGEEGCYYTPDIIHYVQNTFTDKAFLIKAYVTDGTYTYNLYDGSTAVASNINATNYTVSNVTDNTAHQYTLKTNFNGGLTEASNMAGLTLGTASLSNLQMAANDQMTITEGSKLTVSGTLTNTNPANLILENGAELVHNSANVKATVKKSITPPSANDHGWYFIASPVTESITPSEENGFLNGTAESNTYDLYYYDEPDHKWMNHESSAFSLMPQKGYLYANEDGTTLQFTGTLTPSNSSVTINDLSHSASSLNGFNLVGNPFACNATVDEDFYVVNNTTGKVILVSNTAEIAPCAGIFVKATANDASVTFSKATSSVEPSSSSFDIVVKREAQPTRDGVSAGSTTLDRARVRLGDAETLEKFSIGDGEGSVIYFPQNGQDLAVACANGQNEMPLSFKAAENGTYTLAFEVENLDLDYLHLIDNMTGNKVDVLAMPTYTFEAKTSDYASRFKLVFAEPTDGPSADDQPFAYYANGEIRIVADVCDASLQVVDVMGRVVASVGGHTRCVSTTGMVHGVYVLRLIDGDNVRTQKIVIK